MNRKGKFNKTKRGTGKHFSNDLGSPDVWEKPREENEADSSSEDEPQVKGVSKPTPSEPLIEIENPNRIQPKNIKLADLSIDEAPQPMNRKDREAAEAERKKQAFWKAQMEGKTDQAKSDLARLAIIRKQREEAARKRQEEQQALSSKKGESLNAGKSIISKSLGK